MSAHTFTVDLFLHAIVYPHRLHVIYYNEIGITFTPWKFFDAAQRRSSVNTIQFPDHFLVKNGYRDTSSLCGTVLTG